MGVGGVFALAVTTSIDALASGVSLPLLAPPVWISLAVIGGMTTVLSVVGVGLAHRVSERLTSTAERLGGGVLLLIGARILVSHLLDHG